MEKVLRLLFVALLCQLIVGVPSRSSQANGLVAGNRSQGEQRDVPARMSAYSCEEFKRDLAGYVAQLGAGDQAFLSNYRRFGERGWCSKVCERYYMKQEGDSAGFNKCVSNCGNCF